MTAGTGTPPYQAKHRATHKRKGIMPDETTFELASVEFGAEPVAVFRFGYERFELRARLGPGTSNTPSRQPQRSRPTSL